MIKMTRKVPYLIPFIFSLATSSSVFFDYNKIATYKDIGMDCRVSDPEERSSIRIHHGNIEKVTMTTGCIMKSNDSRLSISCIESENSILLSVNLTGYASSDLGTWNCSDGKSYDTVTFQYFIHYPEQPVLSARNLSLNTDQGLFELICSSESRTQPVFSRNPRSYRWNVNGLGLTNLHTCFTRMGPVLSLCRESCHYKVNASISVTCTVEEEGLMSEESEPFIIRIVVPVEHIVNTTSGSASVEYKDQTGGHSTGHSTGALIGACVGCLVAGSLLSVFVTLLIIRRSVLYKKGQKGNGSSGDRNEPFYINSVVDSRSRTTETETTRQYEVLDQTIMEYPKSQYTVILSKGSGPMIEPEMYENARDINM